ncbi:MAG: aspartate--ammonia ligase [Bacilli bacterium]|jgi:aspartate--ammonia ligase|nr:aspartate--ammonia ligase [Bacilli bacterium]
MEKLVIPSDYSSPLSLYETENAIKDIKDIFQKGLAEELNLKRATAPLFLDAASGMNDNLNGVERPVAFDIKDKPGLKGEVVQSLAKWKRYALGRYGFSLHEGLYCDMNAIRRDEELDNIHSLYVDQWDWEKIIGLEDRNIPYLEQTVRSIYKVLKETEDKMSSSYSYIKKILPEDIFFIDSEKLLSLYPKLSPKEREYQICKEKKAVFIERIGEKLSDGQPHDKRAPDYDDWQLNGDILVYYPVLDIALELSSMGIRVDASSLKKQLTEANCLSRLKLPFQKMVMENKVPYTIGGGIGQSRLCMYFLRKAHIGEVQSSLWDEKNILEAKKHGITIL